MSASANLPWMGLGSAFLSSVTWAVGSSVYSRLAREHSPYAVNFARSTTAFPLFAVIALLTGASFALTPVQISWFALSVFSSYAFGDVLFLLSTRSLGIPGALAIASIYPVWSALAGVVLRGEQLSLLEAGGILLCISGVILVILNGPKDSEAAASAEPQVFSVSETESKRRFARIPKVSRKTAGGVLIALLTSVFWCMNSYSVAQGGQGANPFSGNVVRMVLASTFCFILSTLRGLPPRSILLPRAVWLKMSWVFVFEAFGGSLFFMYGLAHSPLASGTVLTALAPVISVPFAWLLGIEKVSAPRTLGVALAVAGVCLLVCERLS